MTELRYLTMAQPAQPSALDWASLVAIIFYCMCSSRRGGRVLQGGQRLTPGSQGQPSRGPPNDRALASPLGRREDGPLVEVVNRGGTTSHNLRWHVTIGEKKVSSGRDQDVIGSLDQLRKRHSRVLSMTADEQEAVRAWAKSRPKDLEVVCIYDASWGQEFRTVRTYPAGERGSSIFILDEQGKRLHLEPVD